MELVEEYVKKGVENGEGKDVSEEVKKLENEHHSQNKPEELSEDFKIELSGLKKRYLLSQLKKLLRDTLQLEIVRCKPGGKFKNLAYVYFKDEPARSKALTVLNGYDWQGTTLSAKIIDLIKDPKILAKIDHLKVPKKEFRDLPLKDRIQKAATPYHDMQYEDQVKEKDKVGKSFLKKFGKELAALNPDLKRFVLFQKNRRKGQICEVDDFVESPVKQGYHNKCEFSIGKSNETDKPIVGFRVANYKESSVEVGPVEHLTHINDKMKEVVKYMEQFLETSAHSPYDPFSQEGVWRQVTVRTSQTDDVMIIVQIHPQSFTAEEVSEIKEDVKKYFTEGAGGAVGVTSIYFQCVNQREVSKEVKFEHVYGKTYVEETILGKTFRASPDAFLQVNTPACEALYEKIAELADIDSTSIVLDICCGVGTMGLCVAESSYKIMGVESVESAVENARTNAEANGIANAVFYHGKAEDCTESMIESSQRNSVIAIVDPPREGLGSGFMNALRKCEYINKIVYITCDPQAALPNLQLLCRPRSNTVKSLCFVPIRAASVDLLPDTPHFEHIILFERYDEYKWERIMSGNPRPKDQEYYDRIPELSEEAKKFHKELEKKRRKRNYEEWRRKQREEKRNRQRIKERRGGERRGGRKWRGGYDGRRGGGKWNTGENLETETMNTVDSDYVAPNPAHVIALNKSFVKASGMGLTSSLASRQAAGGSRGRGRGRGMQNNPHEYEEGFEEGFQEGFQAGLRPLTTQFSGFGEGGGYKMSQTQDDFTECSMEEEEEEEEEEEDSYNNMCLEESQTPCGWDYPGNNPGRNMGGTGTMRGGHDSLGSYAPHLSSQSVTYPISVTNPQQGNQGYGGWNQDGNSWAGGNYGLGDQGGTNYQNFNEPAAKRSKPRQQQQQQGNFNAATNYDYSGYY